MTDEILIGVILGTVMGSVVSHGGVLLLTALGVLDPAYDWMDRRLDAWQSWRRPRV